MSQQTSVTAMSVAFDGMVADSAPFVSDSKYNAESSVEIPFGRAVVRHASDKVNGVVLPHTSASASAAIFEGIAIHTHDYSPEIELGLIGVKPGVQLSVMRIGRVYVTPEESVAPGDPVRFRAVATGTEQFGAFRTSADSTDCVDISAF